MQPKHPKDVLLKNFVKPQNLTPEFFKTHGFDQLFIDNLFSHKPSRWAAFNIHDCWKLAKALGTDAKSWWDLQKEFDFSLLSETGGYTKAAKNDVGVQYAHRELVPGSKAYVTFAIGRNRKDRMVVGYALCSPKEKNFKKAVGRELSLNRLNTKDNNGGYWFTYYNSGGRNLKEMKDDVFQKFLKMAATSSKVPTWVNRLLKKHQNVDRFKFLDGLSPLEGI